MKRTPTDDDFRIITQAIVAGDRIQATSIYLSIAECGLTEAQDFIKTITSEIKSANGEKRAQHRESGRDFWQRLISSLKR